jgi:microcystin-dependent protein
MADSFLGEIMLVGFGYPPRGWAFCQGQTLPISQNQALFSLLGTTYGGNGVTTFQLPDLRARVAVHQGAGPGIGNIQLGESGGSGNVSLQSNQLPDHTHTMVASSGDPTSQSLGNAFLCNLAEGYAPSSAARSSLLPATVSTVGASAPHENRMPFVGLNYIIALQGIFPSRS